MRLISAPSANEVLHSIPKCYFRTKVSSSVGPRRPFGKDSHFFDYDYDSDDDWEEEEQVSCSSCC